ncbi:MAG: aminomethyl-transferring glycine dehydrogenase subunit GcvPA [Roseiflexaceae bacterium]|nr:aminomethyl-transferring glycine dehydrogenase subunit GcvPA [Roseiflexaceae bacterium]
MSHYISITDAERAEMLAAIGVQRIEDLFADVPEAVRFPQLDLRQPMSEIAIRRELDALAGSNAHAGKHSIFLGAGAYNHFVPAAVDQILRRGEFYTAYTPYQPEVSQGTLQAVFEYQSYICRLTGMDVANASHYDGGTALAEAATMAVAALRNRKKIVLPPNVHPQYRHIMHTLLQGSGIEIVGDQDVSASMDDVAALIDNSTAALVVQSPDFFGALHDLKPLVEKAHAAGALLIHHFDPIALALFQTPGEAGADIATAEGQPLGCGLGFGGPYLGIFTTSEKYLRKLPGRIVGATLDVEGRTAYVMTLRAREQDIRREGATSNICTNQALMALAAVVYMGLMGRQGLRKVAELCYQRAHYAAGEIAKLNGFEVLNSGPFFKEFVVRCPRPVAEVNAQLLEHTIVGGYDLSGDYPHLGHAMLLAVTEMNSREDIDELVKALAMTR